MTKEEVLQHVQGVIDAPSAYAGLKDVAKDYLASVEGSIPFVSTKQNIEQAWPAFFMSILRFLL